MESSEKRQIVVFQVLDMLHYYHLRSYLFGFTPVIIHTNTLFGGSFDETQCHLQFIKENESLPLGFFSVYFLCVVMTFTQPLSSYATYLQMNSTGHKAFAAVSKRTQTNTRGTWGRSWTWPLLLYRPVASQIIRSSVTCSSEDVLFWSCWYKAEGLIYTGSLRMKREGSSGGLMG